jgi:hypothetical protein
MKLKIGDKIKIQRASLKVSNLPPDWNENKLYEVKTIYGDYEVDKKSTTKTSVVIYLGSVGSLNWTLYNSQVIEIPSFTIENLYERI